ncbi:MAG: class I SAM-dependent methyltransferase [Candidatus Hydrothermarchaeales archaeon]
MGFFIGQGHAKKWFEFLSSKYDFINPFIYTDRMREQLLAGVEGGRVLDVGVGTGYTTGHMEDAVGIDITWKMIRQAGPAYKGSLVLADASRPPFKERSFSTIISAGSLYYFPDPEKAVKGFNMLLKENGVLLTITPNWRILKFFVHIFSKKDLQELFENAGFKVEKITNQRRIAYFCKGKKL